MATLALLVPCYNAAAYVDDFIRNMAQQTHPFDEILFYDDGSTDDTVARLRRWGVGRVIEGGENRGPSVARNVLLQASNGELIHFHDIDDWLEPTFVEQTLAALTADWDVVITNIRVIDRETGQTRHIHDYSELTQDTDRTAFFLTHCCYPINGLYRRASLEAVGGFREALSRDEDPDLHIRLAHAGTRMRALPEPLAINRFGADTYSARSYRACWQEHLKALRYYVSELPHTYHSILRRDAAHMIGICAANDDLVLAHQYLELCESLGGGADLWQATSRPLIWLAHLVGYPTALNLRFGAPGRFVRRLIPGRLG